MDTNAGTVAGARVRLGPLEVTTWVDQELAVARLDGELDVYSSRELAAALAAVQKAAQRPLLVLDLSGLTFADSSGLGVMIAALKRTKADGGAMALAATPPFFAKVLKVTGLDGILPSHADLETALTALDAARIAR